MVSTGWYNGSEAELRLVTPRYRCDQALQQNEVTNIFEDDFAFLGDDDSSTGNRKENSISEYQSFTDLQHGKGKAVSAIHWLPHRKVCHKAALHHVPCSLITSTQKRKTTLCAAFSSCCGHNVTKALPENNTVRTGFLLCEQVKPSCMHLNTVKQPV